MITRVIKPIPGTGYSIGDEAKFDEPEQGEWIKLGYLVPVKSTPETATIKPTEKATKPHKK